MNRVICLVLGFLALFIYHFKVCFAAQPGDIHIHYDSSAVLSRSGLSANAQTKPYSITVISSGGSFNIPSYKTETRTNQTTDTWVPNIYIYSCFYNSNTKVYSWMQSYLPGAYVFNDFLTKLNSYPTFSTTGVPPSETCAAPVCDIMDDDNDGVCNSCDKLPGQPDKKHCIWNQSYTVDGHVGFMEIDQSGNCDGSSTVSRKNSQLDSQTQYFDISKNHEEITAPTCAGDDATGACKCDYNSSVPSTLSPTSDTVDHKTKEELEKLPDDSNCAEIKAACESACLKYGGTKTNTCTSSDGKTISSCACLDSTTINTITKDNSTTTNTTEGNVSSTGGQDSNSDGKDDTYAAVKDAINDSGIGSKINTTNSLLNGIGNDINGILDSLKNGKTSGSAPLPDKNNYDDKVKDLEEQPFGDAIKDFMVSGLPLIDFIRGTGINNGSGESSLTFNLFGSDLELDFAPYSDLLEWVGLVLVFIASIIAFRIITNS